MVRSFLSSRRECLVFAILIDCVARFSANVSLYGLHAPFQTHDLHLVVNEICVHNGGIQRTDHVSWSIVLNKSVLRFWRFHPIYKITALLSLSCDLKFLVSIFSLYLIIFPFSFVTTCI